MRRAFISSTSKDLEQYRKAAIQICNALDIHPEAMENWSSMPVGAVEGSEQKVNQTDLYIGIFGFRYGHVADGETKSVTELEFDTATENGLDRLCFLADKSLESTWPYKDPENEGKLEAFHQRISKLIRAEFMNVDYFSLKLALALIQGGYYDADDIPPYAVYKPPSPPPPSKLPDIGILPPFSSRTHTPNPNFVGRQDDLRAIAKILLHGNGRAVGIMAAATVGIGGLGKTQLAVEFCFRYGRFFQGVHWLQLPASGPDNRRETAGTDLNSIVQSEIAACGRTIGFETQEQEILVQQTLHAWQQYGPRLVVLDNIEDEKVVRDWLPKFGDNVRVLLTSRRQQWTKSLNIVTHRLDVLSPEESRELLRELVPHLNEFPDDDLDTIAEKFGHLPLALDLAGRYMGDKVRAGITPAEYMTRLDKKASVLDHTSLIGDESEGSPTDHVLNLNATFAISWEHLDNQTDMLARDVFLCAGYCAPNIRIPHKLLRTSINYLFVLHNQDAILEQLNSHFPEDFDSLDAEQVENILLRFATERPPISMEKFELALKHLYQSGLLQIEDGAITIHPLLSLFAQKQDQGERLNTVIAVIALMAYEANMTGLPGSFKPLRSHIEQLALLSESEKLKRTSTLWNNLGFHLDMIGDYATARTIYERALKIAETILSPDSPEIVNCINNLGNVLRTQGIYTEAEKAFERVIRILPEDHLNYGTAINNLGTVLEAQGEYVKAQAAYEKALQLDEAAFGREHPRVARNINNLGNVLRIQGNYAEAKLALEKALQIDQNALGSHHPNVARDLNNLGEVLRAQGDLAGAKMAFEQSIQIDEAAYGPNHPSVARKVNNLGVVLEDQGDYSGARAAFERSLQINQAAFGLIHPNVAVDLSNLGMLLGELGDLETGIQHLDRALGILTTFLPKEHMSVQDTWQGLISLWVQKIMQDKGVTEEEAVEIFKRQLDEK